MISRVMRIPMFVLASKKIDRSVQTARSFLQSMGRWSVQEGPDPKGGVTVRIVDSTVGEIASSRLDDGSRAMAEAVVELKETVVKELMEYIDTLEAKIARLERSR